MKRTRRPVSSFFHSIRFRLVLWFTAILVLVLFAFSAFVYYNQTLDIRGEALFLLERKLTGIEETLSGWQQVQPSINLQESDILVLLAPDGTVLASQGIVSAQDVLDLVTHARQAISQSGSPPARPAISWQEQRDTPAQSYVFIVKPILLGPGQTGYAILGSPFNLDDLFRSLLVTLLLGSLLTLAIALGGGLWLADRAMRPVRLITQTARTISETDLSRRLNLKSQDELGELANTFDGMLTRLQFAFERQRQFVADASHELRTPLTIVNLETSRTLASRRPAQEYRRALAVIHGENDFMTRLVNDLLTLARMDAGQVSIEKIPLDLSDIVLEAVERLAPLAERNAVKLEAGELPEALIPGDRQYLLQMVSNLVENGIKYTSGNDKRVSVETGTAEGLTWLRVANTGLPIPPEHIPHLFERFYRVDQSRTRPSETGSDPESPSGSGLGLSIVQGIVQAHDGVIRVESTSETGTFFEVSFKAL